MFHGRHLQPAPGVVHYVWILFTSAKCATFARHRNDRSTGLFWSTWSGRSRRLTSDLDYSPNWTNQAEQFYSSFICYFPAHKWQTREGLSQFLERSQPKTVIHMELSNWSVLPGWEYGIDLKYRHQCIEKPEDFPKELSFVFTLSEFPCLDLPYAGVHGTSHSREQKGQGEHTLANVSLLAHRQWKYLNQSQSPANNSTLRVERGYY